MDQDAPTTTTITPPPPTTLTPEPIATPEEAKIQAQQAKNEPELEKQETEAKESEKSEENAQKAQKESVDGSEQEKTKQEKEETQKPRKQSSMSVLSGGQTGNSVLKRFGASMLGKLTDSLKRNAANVDDLDYANLLVLSEVGTMGASVDVIERAKAQRAGRRAALSALWVEIESLEGALDATSENVAAVERLVGAVEKQVLQHLKKK